MFHQPIESMCASKVIKWMYDWQNNNNTTLTDNWNPTNPFYYKISRCNDDTSAPAATLSSKNINTTVQKQIHENIRLSPL